MWARTLVAWISIKSCLCNDWTWCSANRFNKHDFIDIQATFIAITRKLINFFNAYIFFTKITLFFSMREIDCVHIWPAEKLRWSVLAYFRFNTPSLLPWIRIREAFLGIENARNWFPRLETISITSFWRFWVCSHFYPTFGQPWYNIYMLPSYLKVWKFQKL